MEGTGTGLPHAVESALIAPVPAAERVVDRHRRKLDHSAAWGVTAHVTVLYPFVPPDRITAGTLARLATVVGGAGLTAFDCAFARIGWFGADVVWLAPDPAEPFRALTRAVWDRFPDHPPYGGAHPDSVPHLTIGSTRGGGDPASLRAAAAEVEAELPVRARIDRLWLVVGADAPGGWRTLREFPLPAG